MKTLPDVPLAELLQEVERRKKEMTESANRAFAARQEMLRRTLSPEFITFLRPHHTGSCTDQNTYNGFDGDRSPRCGRCALIDYASGLGDEYDVLLDVTFKRYDVKDSLPHAMRGAP